MLLLRRVTLMGITFLRHILIYASAGEIPYDGLRSLRAAAAAPLLCNVQAGSELFSGLTLMHTSNI